MLLTSSQTAFSTYLCSSETASGFRPPLATLLFYLSLKVLVSPALCQIDCGLSSLLMLQCEENTPSPGSLAASPRLWLAAIKSQWHHLFSSSSLPLFLLSPPFILWPFLYCLHPDFHSAFPWCPMKCVHNFVGDWQDLSEQEERFSQAEEGWHCKMQRSVLQHH